MPRPWTLLPPLALLLPAACSPTSPGNASLPEFLFGRSGMGPGEFNYPRAAAWSPGGDFYVIDKGGHLQALKPDGSPICGWMMPAVDAGRPRQIRVTDLEATTPEAAAAYVEEWNALFR